MYLPERTSIPTRRLSCGSIQLQTTRTRRCRRPGLLDDRETPFDFMLVSAQYSHQQAS